MRSVASTMFSEAASASSAPTPPKILGEKTHAQDFDHFLSDRSKENSQSNALKAEPHKPAELKKAVEDKKSVEEKKPEDHDTAAEDDAAVKASADEQADQENDKDQKKDEADAAVLTSCLTMWQILPSTEQPAPVPAGELGTEPQEIPGSVEDLTGKGAETGATAASPATAEGANASATDLTADAAGATEPATGAEAEKPAETPAEAALPDSTTLPATGPQVPQISTPAAHGRNIVDTRENKLERATRISAELSRVQVDGTNAAKEQRNMSNPELHISGKNLQAVSAEGEKAETPQAPTAAEKADARAATRAAVEGISVESVATAGETRVPEISSIGALTAETHRNSAPTAAAETKNVAGSEATKLIEHIERTVERMRTQGERHIELRMEMSGGEEVRIKLQMEQGQVKTTFRTDSDGLRQALEQSWSQFSQASVDRSARIGTVVFESQTMQNGTGGFQQSPQQREQNAGGQAASSEFPGLGRRGNAKPVTASSSTTTSTAGATTATSGRQFYA